jgi:2-polyprenyl-3-methyl-5-hydroxy-6-metoxy-1,4-benzoquinol methylase
VQSQQPASKPWTPVTDYSFEARQKIEGPHAELIKSTFNPRFAWDIGCGFGYLVKALRAIGVPAEGMDSQEQATFDALKRSITEPSLPEIFSGVEPQLVICREVLEHLTIREVRQAVANLCAISSKYVYVTTRFHPKPDHLLDVATSDDLDPTHITMLNQEFLRTLFVLEGFKRRKDLEVRMDWKGLGRVLVYER